MLSLCSIHIATITWATWHTGKKDAMSFYACDYYYSSSSSSSLTRYHQSLVRMVHGRFYSPAVAANRVPRLTKHRCSVDVLHMELSIRAFRRVIVLSINTFWPRDNRRTPWFAELLTLFEAADTITINRVPRTYVRYERLRALTYVYTSQALRTNVLP